MTPFMVSRAEPVTEVVPLCSVPDAADEVVEQVARALRGARARTGLSEGDVVTMLAKAGIATDVEMLREAERTGVVTLSFAACLADVYGTTTDGLAGRRLYSRRPAHQGLPTAR